MPSGRQRDSRGSARLAGDRELDGSHGGSSAAGLEDVQLQGGGRGSCRKRIADRPWLSAALFAASHSSAVEGSRGYLQGFAVVGGLFAFDRFRCSFVVSRRPGGPGNLGRLEGATFATTGRGFGILRFFTGVGGRWCGRRHDCRRPRGNRLRGPGCSAARVFVQLCTPALGAHAALSHQRRFQS